MKTLRTLGWISLVIALLGIAWLRLPLRVSDPSLNQAIAVSTVWAVLVGSCLAGAILPRRNWVRITSAAPPGILAVGYPLLPFVSLVGGGPLRGYEVLDSIKLPASEVVAYRTNGGATTDYQILISHLMPIILGVLLVRDLHRGNHEYSAALALTESGTIRATIEGGRPITEYVNEYRLRRYVVF
jgi:hypothetical protein